MAPKKPLKAKKYPAKSVPKAAALPRPTPPETNKIQPRMDITLPNMSHWIDNATTFAQKNPSAVLVGTMAVLLAVLLLLP